MYKVGENWTNEYAKRCGIWQGRCHWYGLHDLIAKLKNKTLEI